ncbi:MAG TPA: radical SAM protein [Verrucomicrobiae bacterium]|nr:radical SAM protein [Verrucomicrobiae bacterium]
MKARAEKETNVLQYQQALALGEVPRYTAGLQVKLAEGGRVYVALSAFELAVYFDNDLALHYDLEGRLTKIATPDYHRRRGLSHRVLATRRLPAEQGGGIERSVLPAEEADALVGTAREKIGPVLEELKRDSIALEYAKPGPGQALAAILPSVELAAKFDPREARRSAEQFHSIYGRVAVLPPDQYNALVLQATEGCAYSCCLFCELYRDVFYGRKTPAQFAAHVNEAIAFHGKALRGRRSIFLGEANALTLSHEDLVGMFRVLQENFELPPDPEEHVPAGWWLGHTTRFDGVSTFLDAFTGPRQTAAEFEELRRLGLRRVYVGLETGDDKLLKWLCKPATSAGIAQCVTSLKSAGLTVGVIALLGAGGHEFADAHVRETARLINQLPLDRDDFIYFSPLVIYPNSRYAEQSGALRVEALTAAQMRAQEQAIHEALRFDEGRGRPHIGRYELDVFVY